MGPLLRALMLPPAALQQTLQTSLDKATCLAQRACGLGTSATSPHAPLLPLQAFENMTAYIALLHKNLPHGYTVTFPDFPDCHATGATSEDVRHNATEALLVHTAALKHNALPLPPPSSLERALCTPDSAHALAFLVELPEADPYIRVNVTMPRSVLAAIGKRRNRSAFLAQAAREKLEREAAYTALMEGEETMPELHDMPSSAGARTHAQLKDAAP